MVDEEFITYITNKLYASLPAIFSRKEVVTLLGKTISAGTLANLASAGCGPPCTRNGRNTIYEKESFLRWFQVYLVGGMKAVKNVYGEKKINL